VGWRRSRGLVLIALVGALSFACTDPTSTDSQTGDSGATPSPPGLPLTYSGTVLHSGDYCHFLQTVIPGNNTLPVEHGCQFDMTKPADVIATDGANYSVSEVVGDARLAVRGPDGSKVMVICRIPPRAQYWFWISPDGHWNISDAGDIHSPQDLVSGQVEESMRPYVKVGSVQNHVQFLCAGGASSSDISLAVNMNGVQFASVTVPMPARAVPLDRPQTPWFVDVGARLVSPGELQGTAAALLLYNRE
jgi:hypothetical protein